jgi:homoserine O-acetyltransferase/O-succinyltransferase
MDERFGLNKQLHLHSLLTLDSGGVLDAVQIAYEIYGTLNADASNAIMLCHALTGDQFAASAHPITGKAGWWSRIIGPGKPLDTDRYCIICPNVIGSCMGSSGPASLHADGQPFAMRFPAITIRDMVRAQALLLDHLGITQLYAVVGGSMGGMLALSWASTFPDRVQA